MNRAEAVQQLKDVYRVLSTDMDSVMAYVTANPTPFAHRTLIRTYFSLVEGLAFQLRQVTLATLEPHPDRLTAAELSLLREERYSLNKKGEPEASENFQRVLPNLLFTIRCYLKNHGASFEPDVSHHGWQALQHTVAVRNRVTHPKSVSDLTLTEEDLRRLIAASVWWKKTIFEMFDACQEADSYWKSRLDETSDAG